MKKKIIFLCHGNICRSPMAEYVMKHLVKQQGRENEFEITSGAVSREEIGNDIYPPAKRKLQEKGFTASDFVSITSFIHNCMLVLLWLHLFILSGVISPLISSGILGTYQPWKFIFQCLMFWPFHTVHGVLKARILKWFAIPFSSGPHSV